MKKEKSKPIYLYDLKRDSGIKIRVSGHLITFHHLDGMYSYCTIDDSGAIIHLSASTPLKRVTENLYDIAK